MATLIKSEEKNKIDDDDPGGNGRNGPTGDVGSNLQVKTEPEQPSLFDGMSLEVLAQVASDRLEIVEHKVSKKKAPKRAVQNMDRLDLEQIKNLSDKLIVSLFSDMTCDEIKKMYTFKCYLIPKTCEHQITVYGNEMKAKQSMKNHLRTHIEALEKVKVEDKPLESLSFEPVPARKKRLAAQYTREQKMKKGKKSAVCMIRRGTYPSPRLKRGRPPSFPQTLQDYVELGMDINAESPDAEKREKESPRIKTERPSSPKEEKPTIVVKREKNAERIVQESLLNENVFIMQREGGEKQAKEIRKQLAIGSLEKIHPGVSSEMLNSKLDKEQLIIDLMQKEQPFQDHNYTSILGRKSQVEGMEQDQESKCDKEDDSMNTSRVSGRRTGDESTMVTIQNSQTSPVSIENITNQPVALSGSNFEVQMIGPTSLSVPILRLPCDSVKTEGNNSTPEEIVLQELTRLAEKMTQKNPTLPQLVTTEANENDKETNSSAQNSIPVVDGEKHAKLAADEANIMILDGEDDDPITPEANPHRRGRKGLENSSCEWERKAALKCIRELRIRKKDESTLVCKICKDKTFTATATLLYHYRSHAGIKPFVCLICNTTFTRQHSLNYHMLIHNNQSRFTCKECGRKFRHPSHFKEHMRRHTGETPYHCTDCPLRFKTRNTYKRHLRTRHDKLLTSCGIQKMTIEEVALNKAMQQYAMEQQHTYQPSEEFSEQDQSTDNTDSEPTGFKAIAPKTEPGVTKSVSTNSALAQALLAPIQTRVPANSVSSSRTLSTSVANILPSLLPSAVSSVSGGNSSCGDNSSKKMNSTAVGLQSASVVSSTTANANLSFLQQTPLTCFAPINTGQPLVLGHPTQLQQFVMALPQQNATTFIAAAPTQPVTMATLNENNTPGLMTSSSQQSSLIVAPPQPLVALATGQSMGQQNVLMATQIPQPILTPLQAVQPLAAAAPNVVQTSNAGTLTLAAPQGAQLMGMTLNQANFLQPFQAFPGATFQVNTTQASALQMNTLTSTLQQSHATGGQQNLAQNATLQIPAEQINALQFTQGPTGALQIVAGQPAPAFQSISALNNPQIMPSSSLSLSSKESYSIHNTNTQSSFIQNAAIISDAKSSDLTQSTKNVVPVTVGQIGSNLSGDNTTTITFNVSSSLPHQDISNLANESVSMSSVHPVPTGNGDHNDNVKQEHQPDTPAARTLLKFCSQVANEMGQVIPTSNNVT